MPGIIPYLLLEKCRPVSKESSPTTENGQEAHRGRTVLAVGKAVAGSEQRPMSPRYLPVETPQSGKWVSQNEVCLLCFSCAGPGKSEQCATSIVAAGPGFCRRYWSTDVALEGAVLY